MLFWLFCSTNNPTPWLRAKQNSNYIPNNRSYVEHIFCKTDYLRCEHLNWILFAAKMRKIPPLTPQRFSSEDMATERGPGTGRNMAFFHFCLCIMDSVGIVCSTLEGTVYIDMDALGTEDTSRNSGWLKCNPLNLLLSWKSASRSIDEEDWQARQEK